MRASSDGGSPQAVIPVVEERVTVRTERVDTGAGVRVHKRVVEHDEPLDVALERDELVVERVPLDVLLTGPAPTQRTEGETLIVPVLEEVLVVEKRLRLKEELRITRRTRRTHEARTVRLRREEVSVERFENEPPAGGRHG